MTTPDPLLPSDVDLRDFQFLPLDVNRFRDSTLVATRSGDEIVAAVLLWSASWHQQPAASLPNDDVQLARLAGYGRAAKEFKRVREGAMHRLVLCSDGRWYHPVVAEKAAEAWNSKLKEAWRRQCDSTRKENKEREAQKLEALPMPARPRLLFQRNQGEIPSWWYHDSAGIPPDGLRNSGRKGREVELEVEGKGLFNQALERTPSRIAGAGDSHGPGRKNGVNGQTEKWDTIEWATATSHNLASPRIPGEDDKGFIDRMRSEADKLLRKGEAENRKRGH